VAQHRLGDQDRIDIVVRALDALLELVGSHGKAAIGQDGLALERRNLFVGRCRAGRHPPAG